MSQPPDDHLKALWQGQDTETKPMTVDAIRARAARYTMRRRWTFLFGFTLMLAEIVVLGRHVLVFPTAGGRVGLIAILVGLGWMTAQFTRRWPGRLPEAKATVGTILEFHRSELERQRETFGSLMMMVGPVLVGVLIFIGAGMVSGRHRGIVGGATTLALIGLWLACAFWISGRQERTRQRRLTEIDATRVEPD
jgi:hypothetical protein